MADETSWRTQSFRQSVVSKIDEAIRQSGMSPSRNSIEMENHVFQKAKSKEEYLGFVARLILHVREMKRDNAKRTGPSGGKQKMLDEVEHVLLSIIGKESACVSGMQMLETGINLSSQDASTDIPVLFEEDANRLVHLCPSEVKASASPPQKRKKRTPSEYHELKIELLKLEIYHRRLQALKLERDLNLDLSEYTQPLFN